MKMKLFRRLVLIIFLVSLPYFTEAYLITPRDGFRISNMVEMSSLVFTGEVVDLEFVFRKNIPPEFTTDITVKVEEMIKGDPNAGENLVKFMIQGGEGIHPETGEHLRCEAEHVPKFKIGEKVLLFLTKSRPERRIPHGGFILLLEFLGKREIKDAGVSIPYKLRMKRMSKEGKMIEMPILRPIDLPENLVVQIAKASLKDVKATEVLEERIKAFISQVPLGQTLKPDKAFLDSLSAEVQKIVIKKNK